MEDLVINSYKEQIKESLLKAKAIEVAGFSVMIEELNRRSINTDKVVNFFNKIKLASSKADLDLLTIDELNKITDDINMQVTRALISPIEMSDTLVRQSRIIARDMSPSGKVDNDNNKFIKIGVNLASEVTKHGIAKGLKTCIKNYCIQKLYQSNYKDKILEKEKELGMDVEESDLKNTEVKAVPKINDSKKSKTMNDIFSKNIPEVSGSFGAIKNSYLEVLAKTVNNLESYK